MKVLVVINSIDVSHGGTSRSSTAVIAKLSEQFPDVYITLLTKSSKNPVLKTFPHSNAKIIFCDSVVSALLKNVRLLHEIDVLHIQGLWSIFPTFIGLIFKLFSKAKLVVSPRGMLEAWPLQQGRFKKKVALNTYQGLLFKLTDIFHVTANGEAKSLSEIIANKNCIVIPNGIDVSRYKEANHSTLDECKKILFLSRIHQKKGIELLIEAWSLVQDDWPNWRVEIIGDGDQSYINSLRRLVATNKIKNINVGEPLYGEAKYNAFSSSDLFVLPTYSENFGIVIAEALASGLPVITTTGTPWSELVTKNCGSYINPTTAELVLALEKWMALNPIERKEAGRLGKELIQRSYGLDSIVNDFYELDRMKLT